MSTVSRQPQLTNKHILLDTCFVIKAYQYSKTTYFDNLFLDLKNNNCVTIINKFIEFEFMRGCQKVEHITYKTNYLQSLSKMTLPITPDVLKDSITISNIYSNKNVNINQIGLVDCCISAYLKKYKDLLLVTLDNDDYPLLLHDRINIETIDTEKEILVLGFYKFNQSKFEKALIDLSKTKI